jgi:O-antigen ligase
MTAFVAALLLTISWIIPEHFPPWTSWHNELFAFAAVLWLGACGLYNCHRQKMRQIKVPVVAWVLAFLFAVVCVQFAIGYFDFLGHALVISFYLFLSVVALICGYHAVPDTGQNGRKTVDYFAIVLVIGSVVSATIALAQVLDIWDGVRLISRMGSGRRPGGNINQPNQLATLILMGLASLIYLFESRQLQRESTGLICFLLMLGLSVTESRTGLLSFFAMASWWWARRLTIRSRLTLGAVAAGSAMLTTLFLYWPYIYTAIQIGGPPSAISTSGGTRLIVWPQLWEAVLQHPWLGWGLGAVSKAHNAVIDAYTQGEPFTYAHNVALDLAVGIGLPLAALLIGTASWWVWHRARATKQLVPWYCLALMLPFGVHSMMEFPFAYSYLLVPAVFAIGILERALAPARFFTVGRLPVATIFVSFTGLLGLSVSEYLSASEDFRVARFEVLRVGVTPDTYVRPQIRILTQLDALSSSTRIRPVPGLSASQIDLMRKVAIHFPSIATQKRYAYCLALNGNPEEAVRQLIVMRAMYPKKYYVKIKAEWEELAENSYPQLPKLNLP